MFWYQVFEQHVAKIMRIPNQTILIRKFLLYRVKQSSRGKIYKTLKCVPNKTVQLKQAVLERPVAQIVKPFTKSNMSKLSDEHTRWAGPLDR